MAPQFYRSAFIQSILEGVNRLSIAPEDEISERAIRDLDSFIWNLPYVRGDSEEDY